MSEHRHLLKSASVITSFTFLSRIFGYLRDLSVGALLGTGVVGDAYAAAFRIPNLLRRLVGEGAVSASFIPVFSRYLADEKRKEAWDFANTILTILTLAMAVVTVLGIMFSWWIVSFFATGFGDTPGKLELTSLLNRIMFPYIFFVSLSALAMGVLNSFQRFGAPAFAPVLLNISIIAFSFLGGWFANPATALAIGVVVGGILQVVIQIPPLLEIGWRPKLQLALSHPGVRRVGQLMAPVMFGVGIVQVNVFVDTQFASYMTEGSFASIYYADRVMELVLGGYAISLATVILHLLSRQAAESRIDEMKVTLNFASRLILFITIPSAVGLIVLRKPIIEVLFQHGNFTAESTLLTAWPLLFFAIGLPAFSMVKIVVPVFYAMHDTRTPVKIAFASMFLNIAFNFLFFQPLENGGPALATSLSAVFNSLSLMIIFSKRYGSCKSWEIGLSLVKFAVGSALMGAVAYVVIHWPGLYEGPVPQRIMALALAIALAGSAYFVSVLLMGSRELRELRDVFRNRGRSRVGGAASD
jgi:putative peptidoglycan lipid II flippase